MGIYGEIVKKAAKNFIIDAENERPREKQMEYTV